MKVILRQPFDQLWAARDPFEAVEQLQGEVYRELEARRTLRTEVRGRGYFVKIHRGVGWREIIKNLITARAPVLGAEQEWQALTRLHAAGVPTMTAVAFGRRHCNPARRHSFIVTEELAPSESLEDFCRDWVSRPPAAPLKHALIREVAWMTRAMHDAGVNHRDCYLCHFLLDTSRPVRPGHVKLALIDLHRAQTRRRIPRRWRTKDLAGLYYSSLDIGLTERDKLRFLRAYFQAPLSRVLRNQGPLLAGLQTRVDALVARKRRYGDAL